jgi:hypothetical protein
MEEYKHQSIREGEMRILVEKNKREVSKKVNMFPFRSSSTNSTTSSKRATTDWRKSCNSRTYQPRP